MDQHDEYEREVRRETDFDAPPAAVWEAITDERLLSEWLADEVTLDPVEGGELQAEQGGERRSGVVERVDDERLLRFTWSREGEEPSTVELELIPLVSGTRLLVREWVPSTAPVGASAAAWSPRLEALALCLTLVAA